MYMFPLLPKAGLAAPVLGPPGCSGPVRRRRPVALQTVGRPRPDRRLRRRRRRRRARAASAECGVPEWMEGGYYIGGEGILEE